VEFQRLVTLNPLRLIHLSATDEDGIIRGAAQELHGQRLLTDYSGLAFPKPDFPLTEESLHLVFDII
jgi:hypothetical protein